MAQNSFSIVIVCLNPGEKLLATVESVLAQQYGNYEIIIKDGGSGDGSLERLPSDSRIRVIAGKDSGIYDAMNQALDAVSGRYVLFLNCGDVLHDAGVLEHMEKIIGDKRRGDPEQEGRARKERLRIFYGDQYNLRQKCAVCSAPAVNDFTCYRNVPCHQVCFYDARLFAERGYDTRYRVRADYEHFLYCIYEKKAEAVHAALLVADYEGGGFSETPGNRRVSAREHAEIAERYLGRRKVLGYRAVMLLTLAPLRTRIAENERLAGVYNSLKAGLYRMMGKGAGR